MNFGTSSLLKTICISVVFVFFALTINAQNKYSGAKSIKTSQSFTLLLDDSNIIEEVRIIEEWMLDDSFWKIKPIDTQNDIINEKEWMKKHNFYIL